MGRTNVCTNKVRHYEYQDARWSRRLVIDDIAVVGYMLSVFFLYFFSVLLSRLVPCSL